MYLWLTQMSTGMNMYYSLLAVKVVYRYDYNWVRLYMYVHVCVGVTGQTPWESLCVWGCCM